MQSSETHPSDNSSKKMESNQIIIDLIEEPSTPPPLHSSALTPSSSSSSRHTVRLRRSVSDSLQRRKILESESSSEHEQVDSQHPHRRQQPPRHPQLQLSQRVYRKEEQAKVLLEECISLTRRVILRNGSLADLRNFDKQFEDTISSPEPKPTPIQEKEEDVTKEMLAESHHGSSLDEQLVGKP